MTPPPSIDDPSAPRSGIEVRRLSGALGAEVFGADLCNLSDADFAVIERAFHDFGVLAIRDQKLDAESQLAFARRFGEPEVHPIVEGSAEHPELLRVWKPAGASASFGVGWHSDNSFFEKPSLGSVLYGEVIPPHGGDTLYANMERAYQTLSEPMRRFLDPLRAVHGAARAYDPRLVGEEKYRGEAPLRYRYSEAVHAEVEHPVIRTHPRTGRRSIYVNPMFTDRIAGLTRAESDGVLALLYAHCSKPDFQCRLRWQPGTVAVWDNRWLWHYAMDDYQEFERVMHRVTVAGEKPA